MMIPAIEKLKNKKTLSRTTLELSSRPKALLWFAGEREAWGSWGRRILCWDTVMWWKNSSQVHETQGLCCLFFLVWMFYYNNLCFVGWFILFYYFFLVNTHKALTYTILIVSNWMKFMKLLAQSVHCFHWDNWSVRNICLLKTTQEGPEHSARPGPQGLPPSGQLCLDAFHGKGAIPATLISPGRGALVQESENLLSHVNFTVHLLCDLNSGYGHTISLGFKVKLTWITCLNHREIMCHRDPL